MRLSTTVWAGPPGLGGASSTSRVQYCPHIRWHVVFKRLHLGQGHAVVTEALGVPKDTQTNIIERFLETGDVQTWQGRREAPPANKVLGCDADLRLLGNVIDDPAATLNERVTLATWEDGKYFAAETVFTRGYTPFGLHRAWDYVRGDARRELKLRCPRFIEIETVDKPGDQNTSAKLKNRC